MRRALPILAIALLISPLFAADEKDPRKYEFKLKALDIKKTDAPLATLLKERYNAAIDCAHDEMERIETGRSTVAALGEAIDLVVGAGLELFTDPNERLALLEESIRCSQFVEKITALRYEAGAVLRSDLMKARYIRLTAEIRLLREKQAKRP
jgi:hypothetical protein